MEECERQAKCTAEVITTIKKRVAELMQKDKMTEVLFKTILNGTPKSLF